MKRKIWIANKPPLGSLREMPFKPGFTTVDCTVGKYALTNMGPVFDIDGNKSNNLHNFMEGIKVTIFYEDNGPVKEWHESKKRIFKENMPYNVKSHVYSYNGKKLDWKDERILLKQKVKELFTANDFPEGNLLLLDYNVPNLGEGFLFAEDRLINYRNYKYSHVYAFAELLI